MEPASQVETAIEESRSLEAIETPAFKIIWEESGAFTQFLLRWNSRPKVFSIAQIFIDELQRRKGLRAYGVRVIGKRRSKVNQIATGVSALQPRLLDPVSEVANTEAA